MCYGYGPVTTRSLAGRWISDSATLHFDIAGVEVRISDRNGTNVLRVDGREYSADHNYVIASRWIDANVLEAVVKSGDALVSRVTYGVSSDGDILTVSSATLAHNGYPAEQRSVSFARGA